MKRIICVLIAVAMVVLLAGCVGESGGDVDGGSAGSGGDGGAGSGGADEPSPTPAPLPTRTPGGGQDGAQKPDTGDGGGDTEEPDGGDDGSGDGSGSGSGSGGEPSPEPTSEPSPTPTPTQTPTPTPTTTPTTTPSPTTSPAPAPTPTSTPSPTPTPGGGGGSSLSGSASDVLGRLIDDIKNSGLEMPMAFPGPPPEVAAEMSHNTIGLTEDDFNRLVTSAAYSQAAIGTFAHQISLIQAKDANAALEIKKLVSGENGFNPQKWVCVWPEQVSAVESGTYVLIAASKTAVVEAAIAALKTAGGSIGSVVTFWEFEG